MNYTPHQKFFQKELNEVQSILAESVHEDLIKLKQMNANFAKINRIYNQQLDSYSYQTLQNYQSSTSTCFPQIHYQAVEKPIQKLQNDYNTERSNSLLFNLSEKDDECTRAATNITNPHYDFVRQSELTVGDFVNKFNSYNYDNTKASVVRHTTFEQMDDRQTQRNLHSLSDNEKINEKSCFAGSPAFGDLKTSYQQFTESKFAKGALNIANNKKISLKNQSNPSSKLIIQKEPLTESQNNFSKYLDFATKISKLFKIKLQDLQLMYNEIKLNKEQQKQSINSTNKQIEFKSGSDSQVMKKLFSYALQIKNSHHQLKNLITYIDQKKPIRNCTFDIPQQKIIFEHKHPQKTIPPFHTSDLSNKDPLKKDFDNVSINFMLEEDDRSKIEEMEKNEGFYNQTKRVLEQKRKQDRSNQSSKKTIIDNLRDQKGSIDNVWTSQKIFQSQQSLTLSNYTNKKSNKSTKNMRMNEKIKLISQQLESLKKQIDQEDNEEEVKQDTRHQNNKFYEFQPKYTQGYFQKNEDTENQINPVIIVSESKSPSKVYASIQQAKIAQSVEDCTLKSISKIHQELASSKMRKFGEQFYTYINYIQNLQINDLQLNNKIQQTIQSCIVKSPSKKQIIYQTKLPDNKKCFSNYQIIKNQINPKDQINLKNQINSKNQINLKNQIIIESFPSLTHSKIKYSLRDNCLKKDEKSSERIGRPKAENRQKTFKPMTEIKKNFFKENSSQNKQVTQKANKTSNHMYLEQQSNQFVESQENIVNSQAQIKALTEIEKNGTENYQVHNLNQNKEIGSSILPKVAIDEACQTEQLNFPQKALSQPQVLVQPKIFFKSFQHNIPNHIATHQSISAKSQSNRTVQSKQKKNQLATPRAFPNINSVLAVPTSSSLILAQRQNAPNFHAIQNQTSPNSQPAQILISNSYQPRMSIKVAENKLPLSPSLSTLKVKAIIPNPTLSRPIIPAINILNPRTRNPFQMRRSISTQKLHMNKKDEFNINFLYNNKSKRKIQQLPLIQNNQTNHKVILMQNIQPRSLSIPSKSIESQRTSSNHYKQKIIEKINFLPNMTKSHNNISQKIFYTQLQNKPKIIQSQNNIFNSQQKFNGHNLFQEKKEISQYFNQFEKNTLRSLSHRKNADENFITNQIRIPPQNSIKLQQSMQSIKNKVNDLEQSQMYYGKSKTSDMRQNNLNQSFSSRKGESIVHNFAIQPDQPIKINNYMPKNTQNSQYYQPELQIKSQLNRPGQNQYQLLYQSQISDQSRLLHQSQFLNQSQLTNRSQHQQIPKFNSVVNLHQNHHINKIKIIDHQFMSNKQQDFSKKINTLQNYQAPKIPQNFRPPKYIAPKQASKQINSIKQLLENQQTNSNQHISSRKLLSSQKNIIQNQKLPVKTYTLGHILQNSKTEKYLQQSITDDRISITALNSSNIDLHESTPSFGQNYYQNQCKTSFVSPFPKENFEDAASKASSISKKSESFRSKSSKAKKGISLQSKRKRSLSYKFFESSYQH